MAVIAKGTPVKFIYSATAASVPATPSAGVFYVFQNGDLWLNTDGTADGNIQIGVPKTRTITTDGTALTGGGDLSANRTITHSTAAGYKHIPAGGAANQVLVYEGTSGTAQWAAVPKAAEATHAETADEAESATTATTAETANKTLRSLIIQFNGTQKVSFNGSGTENTTLNITPGDIGAAAVGHNHDGVYAPAEHTHSQYATTTALASAQTELEGSITTLQGQAALKGSANTFTAANTFAAASTFNGAVTVPAPTAANHAATKTYVDTTVNSAIAAQNAMVFKGIVNTATALPTTGYKVGWTYYVGTAGTYAGEVCEVGDMIICVKNHATGASNADWNAVQTNINGAVVGSTDLTANQVVVGAGSKNAKILAAGTNDYVLRMVNGIPAWQNISAMTAPKAPGTAAVGTATTYAREDHVHPLQTTISGNAATATTASKLSTASAGNTTNPVYFANGIPVASSVKPSDTAPKVAGTAAAGSSNEYARYDHVHPAQTTVSGNAGTATKLSNARTFKLTGAVTGSISSDLSNGFSITTSIGNIEIDDGDLDDPDLA